MLWCETMYNSGKRFEEMMLVLCEKASSQIAHDIKD